MVLLVVLGIMGCKQVKSDLRVSWIVSDEKVALLVNHSMGEKEVTWWNTDSCLDWIKLEEVIEVYERIKRQRYSFFINGNQRDIIKGIGEYIKNNKDNFEVDMGVEETLIVLNTITFSDSTDVEQIEIYKNAFKSFEIKEDGTIIINLKTEDKE